MTTWFWSAYHSVRWRVDQRHQTFWIATGTLATILAFGAAAYYAYLTRQLLHRTTDELQLYRGELKGRQRAHTIIEHREVSGGFEYGIKNLGPGFATEVIYLHDRDEFDVDIRTFGTLAGDGYIRLPRDLNSTLSSEATAAYPWRYTLQAGSSRRTRCGSRPPHLASGRC